MIIEPLSMILIYTLIFSAVIGAKLPNNSSEWAYSIYLCSGLICWEYFQSVVTKSTNMFIEHANLIKKSSFPRSILPLVISISGMLQYSVFLSIFLIFLSLIGHFPFESLIWLPLGMVVMGGLSAGLGLVLGILNVFFRDVGRFVVVAINFLFWGTPIVYTLEIIPEKVSALILIFNPIALIVEYHHIIFLQNVAPDISMLLIPLVLGLFFCVFGFWLFMRLAGEIVDEL
jgi:lipopolysaccharide transport system permease protein